MNWWNNEDPIAPTYDREDVPASDNEYLHHINFKLGYTNTLLKRITTVLLFIAMLLLSIAFWLWHHFG